MCTQVTSFLDQSALQQRVGRLCDAGFDGVIFVGVPRTMNDGDDGGVVPADVLSRFARVSGFRPEILLSFEFVPKLEARMWLIDWLIQDPGNAAVAR